MGTYNYFASLPMDLKLPISFYYATKDIKEILYSKTNSNIHDKYDVSTFKKWWNVKGFMYGTTKEERNANGKFYKEHANKEVFNNHWKGIF